MIRCHHLITTFLQLCEQVGVPITTEKTEWGSEIIIFLGILLDGRYLKLGIPVEKKEKAVQLLQMMISKKSATVKELQSLCGYLNFLCKAIFPGRAFIRLMYTKYSQIEVSKWNSPTMHTDEVYITRQTLKPYHHIRLDCEFKYDCRVWLEFLESDNLASVINHPMVDLMSSPITSTQIGFYSDASGSRKLGYGCILNTQWMMGKWDPQFIDSCKPSIEYIELFALVAGIITWAEQLANCRIKIFYDNISVVHMVNNTTSSCENCMILIRILILNGLRYKRRVTVAYIDTKSNFLADALSRGQISHFRRLGGSLMQHYPDKIHHSLWPISKLWIRN